MLGVVYRGNCNQQALHVTIAKTWLLVRSQFHGKPLRIEKEAFNSPTDPSYTLPPNATAPLAMLIGIRPIGHLPPPSEAVRTVHKVQRFGKCTSH
jgi:hypothetical protein